MRRRQMRLDWPLGGRGPWLRRSRLTACGAAVALAAGAGLWISAAAADTGASRTAAARSAVVSGSTPLGTNFGHATRATTTTAQQLPPESDVTLITGDKVQ